jgi:cyanamide hydratase
VCEAIIRHQDLGAQGTITLLGQLIQLATVYDNVGARPYLVHEATRADVNRAFPRDGWGRCFAATVREEVRLKPWAHSTHLGGASGEVFANAVEGNLLMGEGEDD